MLLAGAMVFVALQFAPDKIVIDPLDGHVVSGIELQGLTASPQTLLSFKSDGVDPVSYAVMSASASVENAGSAGVFVLLGEEYARAYAGKTLRLSVNARAGQNNPAEHFSLGFFVFTTGGTGWKTFSPSKEFSTYEVTTTLGELNEGQPELYFGIWPDSKGDQKTLEVKSYSVEVLD